MKSVKAFWHCLIWGTVSIPLVVVSAWIFISQEFFQNIEPDFEKIGLLALSILGLIIPFATRIFIWHFEINFDTGTARIIFYPAFFGWERANKGIDPQWNFNMYLSEIQSVEIVELTPEEKAKYTSIPIRFNKFFKIGLPFGKYKYIYANPFSRRQQQEIIQTLLSQKSTGNK